MNDDERLHRQTSPNPNTSHHDRKHKLTTSLVRDSRDVMTCVVAEVMLHSLGEAVTVRLDDHLGSTCRKHKTSTS